MNKRESVEQRLAACERLIGYYFSEPALLEAALTHSSLRAPDRECNERLEFLGDSVLGLVITEELYRLLPDQSEGELTRIKSAVVSRSALHTTSTRLGLARYAQFARGVGKRDALPASVVANLVESIIGAIYLDAGYYPAREFVLRHLGDELEKELNDRGAKNYKSLLQHEVQQDISVTPTYRTLEEGGPDHEKAFTVAAIIRGREWGRAKGSTKKEAEQDAARQALEAWERRGRSRRRRRRAATEDDAAEAKTRKADTPKVRKRRRRPRSDEAAPVPEEKQEAPSEAEPVAPAEPAAPAKDGDEFAVGLDLEEMVRNRKPRRRMKRAGKKPAPAPRLATTPAPDEEPAPPVQTPDPEPVREPEPQPDPEPAPQRAPASEEKVEDGWDADGFGAGLLDVEPAKPKAKRKRRAKRKAAPKRPAEKPAEEPAEEEAPKAKVVRKRVKKPAKKAAKRAKKKASPRKKAAKKKAAKKAADKPKKKKAAKRRARPDPDDGFAAGLL